MLSNLQGQALLDDPVRNKGTAFTVQERRKYGPRWKTSTGRSSG
jgi:hypothetical protein